MRGGGEHRAIKSLVLEVSQEIPSEVDGSRNGGMYWVKL